MAGLNRREFLKIGATVPIVLVVGPKLLKAMELMPAGESHNYIKITERTPFPYVTWEAKLRNAGLAFVEDGGRIVQLGGNPDHVTTRGRLTAPENAAYLQVYDPDRIIYPLKRAGPRAGGGWKRISWDDALGEVSERIKTLIRGAKAGRICLNTGRDSTGGAWKRFMHTLGSDNIVSQDSMGDSSKKTAMANTWGADIEAPDFANAKYILIFGSNPFDTFQPYAQMISDGRVEKNAKMVVFDVMISNTSGLSDEWVPVFPGTDGIVALAMSNVIMQEGLADRDFINRWTNYPADKLARYLTRFTPEEAHKVSGVPAKDIIRIAREFATTKPATIFTCRGVSAHFYGAYSERACMLLPIITGNIEVKGGYCLPRRLDWSYAPPSPPRPPAGSRRSAYAFGEPGYLFPFRVKEGKEKVGVLFNYMTNPAYSSPAASVWREVLADESLAPFIVDFSPFMSETASFADIILPDAHYLERTELDGSPALFPWVGIRRPAVKPMGEATQTWTVLKTLIERIDSGGKMGMKKHWGFTDASEWAKAQADNIPGLKGKGGYERLKGDGVWPLYGKLDPKTRKIIDAKGNPVEAQYGLHKKKGFKTASGKIEVYSKGFERNKLEPLPTWKEIPWHKDMKKEDLVLVTYKASAHINSITANTKFLSEILHSNHALINKETAKELKIKDNELIRITSPVGYMVTRARVTNSIHPRAIAISSSFGHWAYGRVAKARPKEGPLLKEAQEQDRDIHHNLWWNDNGVSPNDIIPVIPDPVGGSQGWNDVVVAVTPAMSADKYGDVKADNGKHYAFYKKLSEAARG